MRRCALVAALVLVVYEAGAGALDETRCCITPARTASGEIARRAAVISEFRKMWSCPSTGLKTGACPGWYIDHVIPLACGGIDAVFNLQWLPEAVWRDKSKWERKIYGGRGMSTRCL